MVISHDLGLLDASITRILHLDDDGIVEYKGTYSQYRDIARSRRRAADQGLRRARRPRSSGSRRWPIDARPDACDEPAWRSRSTRGVASSSGEGRGPVAREATARPIPDPPHAGAPCLTVEDLAKAYGDRRCSGRLVLDRSRRAHADPRAERRRQDDAAAHPRRSDRARRSATSSRARCRLGYYAQEHEGIVDGADVLRHMEEASAADDVTLRSLMGMFGLHGDIAFQDAGTLSGGEKTKLALAQLVAGRKNLLLLDEPTNNLDPMSRTAIAEGLRGWPGAMVIVSHDPEFVDSACTGAGLVDAGRPARLLRRRSSRLGGARLSRLDFAHISRGESRVSSTADLVFVNGDVYTVDAARSWARAVAVRDGADRRGRHRRGDPRPDR